MEDKKSICRVFMKAGLKYEAGKSHDRWYIPGTDEFISMSRGSSPISNRTRISLRKSIKRLIERNIITDDIKLPKGFRDCK